MRKTVPFSQVNTPVYFKQPLYPTKTDEYLIYRKVAILLPTCTVNFLYFNLVNNTTTIIIM